MESNRSKDAARENGLVLFRSGNHCEVLTADGESKLSCLCTGAAGEEIAVGDLVAVERDGAASGIIRSVEPRTNHLSRRAAGPRPVEQRIAANLDWGVAVFAAAEPKPHWGMLDRYLVQMETQSIPPLLCVTKSDLAAGVRSLEADLEPYRAAGLPVLLCSCETGEGIGELAALLRGRVSVLVGKSGVGKSTLIQKLTGLTGESLRTAEVSRRTGKGKHTTSEIRMLPLPDGGFVIDTPGAREFALWDVPREEIARGFPEMRSLLGTCRFGGGCTHSHEPDCAVKQAVREGEIDARRYRSYLRLIGRDGDAELLAGKHGADDERRAARGPAEAFLCIRCGLGIPPDAPGTAHRNHCPACLHSRHVDHHPGDRAAGCGGLMEPIAVSARLDGEWTVVHRCTSCGAVKVNRIAGDDNALALFSLAARPLARPPFPLDRLPDTAGSPEWRT